MAENLEELRLRMVPQESVAKNRMTVGRERPVASAIAAISSPSDLNRRITAICSAVARIRRPRIEPPQRRR